MEAVSTTTQDALDAIVRDALPPQGCWREADYLWLTDRTRRLVEFTDGCVEELPMPTSSHQAVLAFLYRLLFGHIEPAGGVVMFAPLRLRIREGKFREPDILALLNRSDDRFQDRFWLGADLAVEVVSPDDPQRDMVAKRGDYASAGIAEYWIVDPRTETFWVLALDRGTYAQHGAFRRGDRAVSKLLPDLLVDVTAVFDARQ